MGNGSHQLRRGLGAFFMIAGLLAAATSSFAALSVDLTSVGSGASVVGRGSAAVGSVENVESMFVNPAGMMYLPTWDVTTSVKSLNNVAGTILTAAGAMPMGNIGTVGAAYINMTAPGGFETDNTGKATGAALGFSSSVMILSIARPAPFVLPLLGQTAIGGSAKLFNQSFSGGSFKNASGSGINLDLGMMAMPKSNLRVGFTVQNILSSAQGGAINWSSGISDTIPTAYKAGIAVGFRPDLWVMADSQYRPQQPSTFSIGGAWTPMKNLMVRLGVQQDLTSTGSSFAIANNLTAGLGYSFAGFDFDYAYRQDSVLSQNTAHFFSISLQGLLNKLPGMKR